MEVATTNIQDLPEIPVSNLSHLKGTQKARENVTLETKELNPSPQLSAEQIQQITQQIQQASQTGGTDLPSRDIPTQTHHLVQDPQIQANYMPPPPPNTNDYIKEEEARENLLRKKQLQEEAAQREDKIYDELQTPIFAMILFFLFQMPFVRRLMKKNIPTFFHSDNNLTLGGYMFFDIYFWEQFFWSSKIINLSDGYKYKIK